MEIEKLKSFLRKNHGYITTREIENIGISKTSIPKLIKQKVLRKVAYGIYIDNNLIEIVNNYFMQKNKDLTTLEEYSKIFKVHEKFEYIMEVLI